jgi:hypothetical protein
MTKRNATMTEIHRHYCAYTDSLNRASTNNENADVQTRLDELKETLDRFSKTEGGKRHARSNVSPLLQFWASCGWGATVEEDKRKALYCFVTLVVSGKTDRFGWIDNDTIDWITNEEQMNNYANKAASKSIKIFFPEFFADVIDHINENSTNTTGASVNDCMGSFYLPWLFPLFEGIRGARYLSKNGAESKYDEDNCKTLRQNAWSMPVQVVLSVLAIDSARMYIDVCTKTLNYRSDIPQYNKILFNILLQPLCYTASSANMISYLLNTHRQYGLRETRETIIGGNEKRVFDLFEAGTDACKKYRPQYRTPLDISLRVIATIVDSSLPSSFPKNISELSVLY